jgi:hypothetical protein
MPAPGLFRSQFGSPPHPQSHRPAGAALQAAPTEPQKIELSGAGSGIIAEAEPLRESPLEIGDRSARNSAARPVTRADALPDPAGFALLAARFVGAGDRKRPVPESRPAFDAAIPPHAEKKPRNHSHDPRHVRRPVNVSASTPRTNVSCHLLPAPPARVNLMRKTKLARIYSGDGPRSRRWITAGSRRTSGRLAAAHQDRDADQQEREDQHRRRRGSADPTRATAAR